MLTNAEATSIAAGAAVLSALGAAALTGVITYKVTSRQVSSSESLAREARYQDRILRAYLTLMRYADDLIAQVGNDRRPHWMPPPVAATLVPELTREEMSFSWLVCSPEVARLHLKVTEAAQAYGQELAIRTEQLLATGLEPAALLKVWRAQAGQLPAFFDAGDRVAEAADALLAQMRSELGAKGVLPAHRLPTLEDIESAVDRYIERTT